MSIEIRDIAQPVQFLVPRNGKDMPMIVPEQGGKPEPFTRTTTFIDCIEDKSNLADWGKRMVLLGCSVKPGLAEAAKGLDPKADRQKLGALAEQAMEAAGAHVKREKGTDLHGLSEIVDAGQALPDGLADIDMMDMAEYLLLVATYGLTFSHVEKFVVVPDLKVGGTPDRICHYRGPGPDGKPIDGDFIFDLKTGTVEYGGLKMASQLAAYSRAKFYDPTWFFPTPPYAPSRTKKADPVGFAAHKAWKDWCETEFDAELAASAYTEIPAVNQEWGIILNLPAGSGDGGLFWADLRIGWEACELALVIRKTRSLSSKALRPFSLSSAA